MTTLSIQELLDNIKRHNDAYRSGSPIINDSDYDKEIELLKELDPQNEWFKHVEPSPVSNSRKRKLPLPMKSLNKVKSINELKKWLTSLGLREDAELVLMPKFDGLSLLHDERNGAAWSRGGADNEGQDCTPHCVAANIRSDAKFTYTYGEFIINRKEWGDFFDGQKSPYTGEAYKSPRNTAAGFLNRDEPCAEITHASFFRYGVDPTSLANFNTFHDVIMKICNVYHQRHLYKMVVAKDITEQSLMFLFKEWSKLYPIDGIVVYINDRWIWDSIGRNQTTGNPLYAVAYKHPDFTDSFETTVKNVSWRASKSGALKPVVEIDAVNTGDCVMENPTGYNAGWISDMDIAKGAKVLVTRSGGVIPKILQTLEPAPQANLEDMWDSLAVCPHCGRPTAWNDTHKELVCTNQNCDGINLAKIRFFFKTCGVDGMGEEMFDKLYSAGFTSISSILDITAKDIISVEGFAEGIASIILDNMKKIKAGVQLPVLMQASDCFPGIGAIKAKKLIDSFDGNMLDNLYDANFVFNTLAVEAHIESTNLETEKSFWRGVNKFHQFVRENGLTIKRTEEVAVDKNGKCVGMSVCFSGIRDNGVEEKIVQAGGTVVSGVSKKTTHLVVKDVDAVSGKITKAKDLGVTIMDIETFKAMFV